MEYKSSYLQKCTNIKERNFKSYMIMLPNSVKKRDFYWKYFLIGKFLIPRSVLNVDNKILK